MSDFNITIKGLEELILAFKKSPEIVKKQIQKAISSSVALVNRQAKIETPVITGRLRSGIRSGIHPFKGIVESTVGYGIFVHARNPFMLRGSEKSTSRVQEEFKKALENITIQLAK